MNDAEDGWPLHKQLAVARVPEKRYAAIKLGRGSATAPAGSPT